MKNTDVVVGDTYRAWLGHAYHGLTYPIVVVTSGFDENRWLVANNLLTGKTVRLRARELKERIGPNKQAAALSEAQSVVHRYRRR